MVDFPLQLFSFCLQVKPVEVRQAAGLLLKNNLRVSFKTMAAANQQYIKAALLPCLGSPDRHIRTTTGSIITVIVQLVGVVGWPELLQALLTFLDSSDLNQVEGAMDALSKVWLSIFNVFDVFSFVRNAVQLDIFIFSSKPCSFY